MATFKTESEVDVVSSLETTTKSNLSITDIKNETSCADAAAKNMTSSGLTSSCEGDDGKILHTTSATNSKADTSFCLKDSADTQPSSVTVFDTAVKSVGEKIEVYLADSRSVNLKKSMAHAILQDLQVLVSCLDDLDEHSYKQLFSILTAKATIMKNFYVFLL